MYLSTISYRYCSLLRFSPLGLWIEQELLPVMLWDALELFIVFVALLVVFTKKHIVLVKPAAGRER